MRHTLHQRTVHERAGVALVGVADQNLLVRLLGGEKAPLVAGREAAASAAAQPGALHFVHHFGGGHRERLLQPPVAAVGDVVLVTGRVDPSGERQHLDQLLRLAGGRNFKPAVGTDREDVCNRGVGRTHIAVEDRFAGVEEHLHQRFGIAVAEASGAFDRNRPRVLTEPLEDRISSGCNAAARHADADFLDSGVAHFASYSFRILIMLLRSSLP